MVVYERLLFGQYGARVHDLPWVPSLAHILLLHRLLQLVLDNFIVKALCAQ